MKTPKRIFLSPPHMGELEMQYIKEAFASNYIAPMGPQIDLFEQEFAEYVGSRYAVAVSSGTAALHLAMRYAGVGVGDTVICSTLTFVASANAILYQGAKPIFIDSETKSWNMDPDLLLSTLTKMADKHQLPKAVVVVHAYGQTAEMDPIVEACEQFSVPIVEDAAEALGATYGNKMAGSIGLAGIFSFNGNKIMTTSGGGMLVSDDKGLTEKIRFWATQARDSQIFYEHSEMGYNYRMSNVLAAIGRGQLSILPERIKQKRNVFEYYKQELGNLPGVSFMPEASFGKATRWLTCMTIDPALAGIHRDAVINRLDKENIESRPVWKPMHLQPLFRDSVIIGGKVSRHLFEHGVCLPSGSALTTEDLERITHIIKECFSV